MFQFCSFFFFPFLFLILKKAVLSDATLGKFVEKVWLLVEILLKLCQLCQNIQVSIYPGNGET